MPIYKPYTYLIGWSHLNKYYYGVRYAKGCSPEDLWSSYFTSSKHVNYFYQKHGDPDIIQIRKTFNDKHKAVLWEKKVLNRMNLKDHPSFLNATNNESIISEKKFDRSKNFGMYAKPGKRGTYEELFGVEKAKKMKKRLSESSKGNSHGSFKRSEETKKKMSAASYERWNDPDYRKKNSYKWVSNTQTGEIKRVQKSCVQDYIDTGWIMGRKGFSSHK